MCTLCFHETKEVFDLPTPFVKARLYIEFHLYSFAWGGRSVAFYLYTCVTIICTYIAISAEGVDVNLDPPSPSFSHFSLHLFPSSFGGNARILVGGGGSFSLSPSPPLGETLILYIACMQITLLCKSCSYTIVLFCRHNYMYNVHVSPHSCRS